MILLKEASWWRRVRRRFPTTRSSISSPGVSPRLSATDLRFPSTWSRHACKPTTRCALSACSALPRPSFATKARRRSRPDWAARSSATRSRARSSTASTRSSSPSSSPVSSTAASPPSSPPAPPPSSSQARRCAPWRRLGSASWRTRRTAGRCSTRSPGWCGRRAWASSAACRPYTASRFPTPWPSSPSSTPSPHRPTGCWRRWACSTIRPHASRRRSAAR
mmetsp:Transcript_3169/g.6968  ORF Transcript_3169/g.6968 Transcript_3169/m.6968 type:complete len:221 (+) Transcript_3169:236-898(+)